MGIIKFALFLLALSQLPGVIGKKWRNGRRGSLPPMGLRKIGNSSVVCNDGTSSGYYFRKSLSRSSKVWIVFLEGGWYCFDDRSCGSRWLQLRNLMSSADWPSHRNLGGILSADPQDNPYWWSANHIFVPYCSSDSWSGRRRSDRFSFMGSSIVEEVVKALVTLHGFTSSATLILAGSSAGGTGVMVNLDRIDQLLNIMFQDEIVGRVRGISDSGWFIDKLPLVDNVSLVAPEGSLKKGIALWDARLPVQCLNNNVDQPWNCLYGYKIYPGLKAPLFVFQWLFDEAQMLVNNVRTPAKKEDWDFVYKIGNELKKTLANVSSAMVPACISHTVLTNRDWVNVEVNSVYLPKALKCWESGGIIEESNSLNRVRGEKGRRSESSRERKKGRKWRSNDSRRGHRRRHEENRRSRRKGEKKNRCGQTWAVDKCSWPQCNRSCPKLVNPVTEEEVDFKDLLRSFGLDMDSVAKALGIDSATLDSMDHRVLLQMLTRDV